MAEECIFCRIARGEVPAKVVRDDDHTIAFHDLDPKAPLHVLIIPKRHIGSINDVTAADAAVMGELFVAARAIAETGGVAVDGYRVVMNTGAAAGQSVQHAHLHLLGGRQLRWPPG
ncbi:MAG: histidine triad nucleotide-binding protein [Gemmatimonadota bacterium]